jgi:hypothetical protein
LYRKTGIHLLLPWPKKKKEIGRQIIACTHTSGWLISKQLIYEDKFLAAYKTNSILSVTGKVIYVDEIGKITYKNLLQITIMIFHSTNIFVNLVKLMQKIKMKKEKKRTMFFQIMKSYHFIWVTSLYIWLDIWLEETVTSFNNSFNNLNQVYPSWADQA